MNRFRHPHRSADQRGATLFVGLVMLLLLTLQALAALHTGTAQLRIAGNVQEKHAAEAAAETAVGRVIAEPLFPQDPRRAASVAQQIDANGDGAPDFIVTIMPTCRSVRSLPGNALDPDRAADTGCLSGSAFGGSGSLCARAQWDIEALAVVASDSIQTGVRSEVHQGVAIRMTTSDAVQSC